MARRATARSQRFAACLAAVALAAATHVSAAEAHSTGHARQVTPVAHTSSDVISDMCNLLKLPVTAGAKKLVSLFTKNRFTILASALIAPLATKYFCKVVTPKLKQVVRRTIEIKPSLAPRVGPFVFNLYADGSNW